jgi:hypothetical protein
MALAVFSGSLGSSGGGAFDVLTEQNLQPRVQVSPISMIVAVAVSELLPPLQKTNQNGYLIFPFFFFFAF